jgi:transcription initiation factor IIE alpha subunit
MKCAICGIEIESIDEVIEQGWIPYFYEEETEHEFACPGCSEIFLESDEDGEMEVKEEYLGKIKYLDEVRKEHLIMGVMLR